MADHAVQHDRIIVSEETSPAEVRVLAEQKAQSQVPQGYRVAFLYLHGATPAGGGDHASLEWRFSYQSIPPESRG
jgi:hypothetical protein